MHHSGKEADMLRKVFAAVVVVNLMFALGGGATDSVKTAEAGQGDRAVIIYTHGLVWNRALPGLAGELLLTFDVRADLETGTGFGTTSDSVHPEANFHFSIDSATRKGNTITLQGMVIQANDPANLGLPVALFAEFHGTTTAVTIELGDLAFRGSGFANSGLIVAFSH
jgi:hypothetical protein